MPSRLMWLRAAAIAAVAAQVAGQQCYYRNGKEAPSTEKACSSAEGSACCPDKWECLDNGLCHYPADNLYGRYSCTDQSWNSPGCASNMCTYGGTAGGGESITQCSNHNNDWCCNGDAEHVNCCQESPSPRPFFALASGSAYATIGARQASSAPDLASITGLASGSGGSGGSSATQTSAGGSSTSAGSRQQSVTPDSVSTASPITSVGTTTSSGSAGIVTMVVTSVITPTPTSTGSDAGSAGSGGASSSSGGGNSNLGVIIGCAVGIPLALALAGIIFWLCRKRRNQKANPYKETPELGGDSPHSPGFTGGAAAKLGKNQKLRHSRPGTAEIDGNPVGVGRPVSTVKGHAELAAGQGFQPGQGTPYAPDTVGLGGGSGERNTWGSVPPQYSPGQNHAGFANAHPNAMELDGTSVMPVINEKSETPQQYQAYKPPNPVAELPSIKTPPEDLEKQLQR
ncbi:hypothetical protein T440DRAFT_465812 [Plenodomus tracheiphilus IPT5]|uniref:Mid2 domain-containing protein n=1 Tax=Plenodomus tracheiphilus IPT5 TaxID=1408161 RepID=A0A6A7BDJ7_9PLEO|nr:hypothetical protein T440DRAFT_465812 [Plenodomus tracheiphilus IPT5]